MRSNLQPLTPHSQTIVLLELLALHFASQRSKRLWQDRLASAGGQCLSQMLANMQMV